MTEGQGKQPIDTRRPLSGEYSDMLKAFGFDPGIPVYEVGKLDFDLDRVKQALFESTYRSPITLPFYIGSRNPMDIGPDMELFMVVELVQAYYAPYTPCLDMEQPVGCYNRPEWYMRGFQYKSGFDAYPKVLRMHAYIATGGAADDFNYAIVQVVRNPSGADPVTRLVYGNGIPGQS